MTDPDMPLFSWPGGAAHERGDKPYFALVYRFGWNSAPAPFAHHTAVRMLFRSYDLATDSHDGWIADGDWQPIRTTRRRVSSVDVMTIWRSRPSAEELQRKLAELEKAQRMCREIVYRCRCRYR